MIFTRTLSDHQMNEVANMNNVFFPEALKAMQNWTAWKLELRKDKLTKVPYTRTGKRASSTDRNTWSSFDAITELLSMDSQYNGYGFMVSDDVIFIDVDHCISADGTMDERGSDILSAFPVSYAEISQSGTGLHILTQGTIPRNFNNQKHGIEMYSSARFCAMTGNAIQAFNPTLAQDAVDYVFNKYCTHRDKHSVSTYSEPLQTGTSMHSDRWIIAHAMNITGQKGRNFRTLFSGDISAYGSASEADSALCTLLAFWCDRDFGQMDRIFRQSGLYRKKWEREDYRIRTLSHACEHLPESLSEWYLRNQKELKDSASAILLQMFGG